MTQPKSYTITVREYICQAFDSRADVAITYQPKDPHARPWHVMSIKPHSSGTFYLRYRAFRSTGRQAAGFCPISLDAELLVTPLTSVPVSPPPRIGAGHGVGRAESHPKDGHR